MWKRFEIQYCKMFINIFFYFIENTFWYVMCMFVAKGGKRAGIHRLKKKKKKLI